MLVESKQIFLFSLSLSIDSVESSSLAIKSSNPSTDFFGQEQINKNETSIIVLTQASLVDLFHSSTPLTTSDGCVVTSVLRNTSTNSHSHNTKDSNDPHTTTNNKSIICSTNQIMGDGRPTTQLTQQLVMFNPTNINSNNFEGNTALSASSCNTSSNVVTATSAVPTTTTSIALENAGHSGQKSIIMALNSSQQVKLHHYLSNDPRNLTFSPLLLSPVHSNANP